MKYEGVTFPEALRILAQRSGITLERSQPLPEADKDKSSIFAVNNWATEFYHKCLVASSAGKAGLDYLTGRQINRETIDRLKLGYAPEGWDTLLKEARRSGFRDALLLEAGLVIEKEGGGVYDRFRGRVMFPIQDPQARVVGFGGRVIGEGEPKYLNSPETRVYQKGKLLYLAERAKLAMRETRRAVVVEGYMDAIVAHEYGFTNAVAVLGTALTPDHVRYLKRFVDETLLVFDGDAAGIRSAHRSLESFAQEELPCRVVTLPDGLDPCDCLQQRGKEAFAKCLEAAVDDVAFRIRTVDAAAAEGAGLAGARAVDEALELVAHMPNPVTRSFALDRVAQLLDLPRAAVRERFEARMSRQRRAASAEEPAPAYKRDPEAELAQVMLNRPEVMEMVHRQLDLDMIRGAEAREVIEALLTVHEQGREITSAALLETVRSEPARELAGRIMETEIEPDGAMEWAAQLVATLRRRAAQEETAALQEDIRKAPSPAEVDDETLRRYLERKRLAHQGASHLTLVRPAEAAPRRDAPAAAPPAKRDESF